MGLIRNLFLHGNQLRKELVEARRARRVELRKYPWWVRLLILLRARRILILTAQTRIMEADKK